MTLLALVTGASRGIGRACALELAASGYDVIATYRAEQRAAESLKGEIEALGRQAMISALDVGAGEAAEKSIDALLDAHGLPDAVVCNAGITKDGLFPMMSRESWDSVLAVNLGAFYSVLRPITRRMIRRRSGSIVTVASVSGQRGNAGQVNYSASKAGLVGATKALALELGSRNIRVNAVAPGFIETDMVANVDASKVVEHIALGRAGNAAEVAAVVNFLCSDAASYVTGQVIGVNGGLHT